MNILKATIATAAVITCCLGNEMPAKAQISDYLSAHEEKLWDAGYTYGYEYGMLVNTCIHYHLGHLSRNDLKTAAISTSKEPDHISKRILRNFREIQSDSAKACLPTIEEAYGIRRQPQPAQKNSSVRTTEHWL